MKPFFDNIELLRKYSDENSKEILKKFKLEYGIPENKIKMLSDSEREMIFFPMIKLLYKDMIIESCSNSEDINEIEKSINEFYLFSDFGFFEVITVDNKRMVVNELGKSYLDTINTKSVLKLKRGDIFFGFIYPDGDFDILDEFFVLLADNEKNVVYEIYENYDVENALDVFVDNIIVKRLMEKYLDKIDDLIARYSFDLLKRFDQFTFMKMIKHFSNTAKYNLLSNYDDDIYNMDYYKFFLDECDDGNFIVEGELEDFLNMLLYIFEIEYKNGNATDFTYESIVKSSKDILKFKGKLSENYKITDKILINEIMNSLDFETDSDLKIFEMGYYMEILANINEIKVTEKTRRLSADFIKTLESEYLENDLDGDGKLNKKTKEMLQFTFSFMIANGLSAFGEDNTAYIENRFMFFSSQNPYELIGNILTGFFFEDTFEYYISRKNTDYKKLLSSVLDAIKTEDFESLKAENGGTKILTAMYNLGIVDIEDENENSYVLDKIGRIYRNYLEKLNTNGKVIDLKNYLN